MLWRFGRRSRAADGLYHVNYMVAGADQGDSFKRDMGYSEKEFFRVLPSAVSGYSHNIEGNRVIIVDSGGNQQLKLIINQLPDREIGMIRIPRIEVEFAFHNFPEEDRKNFMTRFDHSYQRGGG